MSSKAFGRFGRIIVLCVIGLAVDSCAAVPESGQISDENTGTVLPVVFKVGNGPFFKDKGAHEEIHITWPQSINWIVPGPNKIRVASITLLKSTPPGAPEYPFPRKREQLETFKVSHNSGPADEGNEFEGRAEYKATYKLENGESWDPHIVIDWP